VKKRITALIMAALFMLSVLAVGPAGAVGKWEPPKKDPKVCVKWVKVVVVKWDKKKVDKFKVVKFLFVKKSKFHLWAKADWDLGKGKHFKFFKVKKKLSKKECWDKNAKKFKKGTWKKPIFPEPPPPPPPPELVIEDCLVHFTSSEENPINILTGVDVDNPGHIGNHTDDEGNRIGSDFNAAGPYPVDDPALVADLEEALLATEAADDNIITCDELDDLVDGPDADQAVIDALVALGDEEEEDAVA